MSGDYYGCDPEICLEAEINKDGTGKVMIDGKIFEQCSGFEFKVEVNEKPSIVLTIEP